MADRSFDQPPAATAADILKAAVEAPGKNVPNETTDPASGTAANGYFRDKAAAPGTGTILPVLELTDGPAGSDKTAGVNGQPTDSGHPTLNIGEIKPGTTMQATIKVDGQDRPVDIHVPTGYDASKPTPVLYMLSGQYTAGGARGLMEKETGMDAIADQKGFIVVYPVPESKPQANTGVGSLFTSDSWNAPGASLSDTKAGYNDIDYIKALTQAMPDKFSVDPSRVGISGFSEGGEFAQAAAAAIPHTFSSVISDNGTWLGTEKRPQVGDKTSALIINGDKNYALPLNGGRGLLTVQMPKVATSEPLEQKNVWLESNQIDPHSPAALSSVINNGRVAVTDYAPGAATDVETMIIKGGKNAWDGGAGGRGFWKFSGLGGEQSDIPISQYTADFFLSHPRPDLSE